MPASRTDSAATVIELDGSHGEGGGALLRTALTASALTQQPLHISQIRGGTNHPGLDLEDLTVLQALASSTQAEVTGGEVSSQSLTFTPKRSIGPVTLKPPASKGVRGANGLVVLGTLLPVLARCGVYSDLSAVGETYGTNTLTYDYFAEVTLGAAKRMGLYAYPTLAVSGFGRESFGQVHLEVEPSALHGIEWKERGPMRACKGLIVSSQLPPTIGSRAVQHLERLAQFSGLPLKLEAREVPGSNPGLIVTLWAEFEKGLGGVANVGQRGVRVETVAQGAFEALSGFLTSDATVDAHLADQILLLAILAEGPTTFTVPRLTQRLLTMVWVIKQFTPIHIVVQGAEGRPGMVTIRRA
jgi:RNA 3'-terminal phosphate cyclase (ATP)